MPLLARFMAGVNAAVGEGCDRRKEATSFLNGASGF